jgi:hypothetical protein
MVIDQVHSDGEQIQQTATELKRQFFARLLDQYGNVEKIPESEWQKILVSFSKLCGSGKILLKMRIFYSKIKLIFTLSPFSDPRRILRCTSIRDRACI